MLNVKAQCLAGQADLPDGGQISRILASPVGRNGHHPLLVVVVNFRPGVPIGDNFEQRRQYFGTIAGNRIWCR